MVKVKGLSTIQKRNFLKLVLYGKFIHKQSVKCKEKSTQIQCQLKKEIREDLRAPKLLVTKKKKKISNDEFHKNGLKSNLKEKEGTRILRL